MPDAVLISDPSVTCIPIRELGEALRDVRDEPRLQFSKKREAMNPVFGLVRSSVLGALLMAQQSLPNEIKLVIEEGFRPLDLQSELFRQYLSELTSERPNVPRHELEREATKYVAKPSGAPPHSTGGAVDVGLASACGELLDMGSDSNDTHRTNGDANYVSSRSVSARARFLRRILSSAMQSAGFVNYPPEWWHWSMGDQYWAYCKQRSLALYGSVELSEIDGSAIFRNL